MTRRSSFAVCVCLFLVFSVYDNATAKEPVRIWVDVSGRYFVEAALVKYENGIATLRRKDGGTTRMRDNELSTRDNEYLKDYEKRREDEPLQLHDPRLESPHFAAQEPLDFPDALSQADEKAELNLTLGRRMLALQDAPQKLSADPDPNAISLPQTKVGIDRLGAYDHHSRLILVGSAERPALGLSINAGFRLNTSTEKVSRLVKFDPAAKSVTTVYESDTPITLLDHHVDSGHSLVLMDHDSLGQGGLLAIATGWSGDRLEINTARAIPMAGKQGQTSKIRWARMLDEENVIAVLDDSLVRWNITSAECHYRYIGVNPRAIPALSGGRRYIAVPTEGAVNLYETKDGKPLGRVTVDSNSVASVSFARHGGELITATPRQLRTWSLVDANVSSVTKSSRNLGRDAPIWIEQDLVLSGSGVMLSTSRGVPLWHYQIAGTVRTPIGDSLAFIRKHPTTDIAIFKLPHDGVKDAIRWIDSHPTEHQTSSLPGRSVWGENDWQDREVRIGFQSQSPADQSLSR